MKFSIGKWFYFSFNEPSKFEVYRKEISEIINLGAEIQYNSKEINFKILTTNLTKDGQYFRITDLSLSEIDVSEVGGKKLFNLYVDHDIKISILEI